MLPLALTAYEAGRFVGTVTLAVLFVLLLLRAFDVLPRKKPTPNGTADRRRRGGDPRGPAHDLALQRPGGRLGRRRRPADEGGLPRGLRVVSGRRGGLRLRLRRAHQRGAVRHAGGVRDAAGPRPAGERDGRRVPDPGRVRVGRAALPRPAPRTARPRPSGPGAGRTATPPSYQPGAVHFSKWRWQPNARPGVADVADQLARRDLVALVDERGRRAGACRRSRRRCGRRRSRGSGPRATGTA